MDRYPRTILGTCCVPWNEDLSFDEATFRQQVRHLLGSGQRDLYIFGTAGEGYAVSDGQFKAVTSVFAEEMGSNGAAPMVGVISLSLPTIIERIAWARERGVRDFQISLPSWGALSDKELFTFFREVCARFPDCRFLHYNLVRTKRLVTPAEYSILAEEHPNLVATKHGTGDMNLVSGLLREAPQLRHFFTESGFAIASLLGESDCGFLVSIASSNLQRARAYFEAGVRRDTDALREMHGELGVMTEELLRAMGAKAHMDGAYDKIFCKLHDESFPLRLLPPYEWINEELYEGYKNFLRHSFPQWLPTSAE